MIISLLAMAAVTHSVQEPAVAPTGAGQPELRVSGRTVMAGNKSIRLRGVNVASLEWSSDGEGRVVKSVQQAIEEWKCNIIRLPLSQDRWFGKASEQKDGGESYRAIVSNIVATCAKRKTYVILDLHWNNAGEWGRNIGQHHMPDMNSITFWKSCAAKFANHPAVIFDLYNEPHDTSYTIWRDGGTITETRGVGARQGEFKPVTYRTPGMQAMLDAVRSTGARNVAVVGGLDWAYDLAGVLRGYALKDRTGNGIIYACHSYPFKGDTVDQWLIKLDAALKEIPVIVSEFGDTNPPATVSEPNAWVRQVLDALELRKCHWTAWDFHPLAGPCLVDKDYQPTPSFGKLVKSALAH